MHKMQECRKAGMPKECRTALCLPQFAFVHLCMCAFCIAPSLFSAVSLLIQRRLYASQAHEQDFQLLVVVVL
jgi:hypothetical protein